jgi:hypothetical protein
MTAPLTGAAGAPDVAASPMPAAVNPAMKIVRIAVPPFVFPSTLDRQSSMDRLNDVEVVGIHLVSHGSVRETPIQTESYRRLRLFNVRIIYLSFIYLSLSVLFRAMHVIFGADTPP